MKHLVIAIINLYQKVASLLKFLLDKFGLTTGNNCVFYPTCSVYTKEAVLKYGTRKGVYLGIKRILRCHPWQKNHIDPVP